MDIHAIQTGGVARRPPTLPPPSPPLFRPRTPPILAVILAVLALAGLRPSPLGAQPAPPTAGLRVDIDAIDIVKFPLVQAVISVLDPEGRAVTRIDRSSFTLAETGLRTRLEFFRIDVTPLAVAILIDISGSMVPSLLDAKRAAGQFLRLLEPTDETMLMSFAGTPQMVVPPTTDHEKVLTGLGPLQAYGPTALYDAIHASVLELKALEGRRAIVLLTDGRDQDATGTMRQSRHSLDEALALAHANQVRIFAVGLGARVDRQELTRISHDTQGTVYFPPLSRFLGEIYRVIAANLKGRILIHYRTPDPQVNGTWRTLEVKVTAKGQFGSDQAAYRAPGRYLLEIPGQGFDRLRVDQLGKEEPSVVLRDVNLRELLSGAASSVADWIKAYYKRPQGP